MERTTLVRQESLAKLDALATEIQDVKKEIAEIKGTVLDISKEKIDKQINKWEVERKALLKRIHILENKENRRERKVKRNNIVISSLEADIGAAKDETEDFLRNVAQSEGSQSHKKKIWHTVPNS